MQKDKYKKTDPFYLSSAWRRCRKEILIRDNYLCQYCLQNKKIIPADTVHHIKLLEDYPELALEPANLISLCSLCHNREHPENPYFAKLKKKIVVVLGYPASGKTTYVRGKMTGLDIVLDLDRLVTAMTYRDGHDRTGSAFHAVRIADDMIKQVARDVRVKGYSFNTLYVIRSRLSDEELAFLRGARAKFYWIDTDKETCLERLRQQGRESLAVEVFAKCERFLKEQGARLIRIRPRLVG